MTDGAPRPQILQQNQTSSPGEEECCSSRAPGIVTTVTEEMPTSTYLSEGVLHSISTGQTPELGAGGVAWVASGLSERYLRGWQPCLWNPENGWSYLSPARSSQ